MSSESNYAQPSIGVRKRILFVVWSESFVSHWNRSGVSVRAVAMFSAVQSLTFSSLLSYSYGQDEIHLE